MPGFTEIPLQGISEPSEKSGNNANIEFVDEIELVQPLLVRLVAQGVTGSLPRDRFYVGGWQAANDSIDHQCSEECDEYTEEESP